MVGYQLYTTSHTALDGRGQCPCTYTLHLPSHATTQHMLVRELLGRQLRFETMQGDMRQQLQLARATSMVLLLSMKREVCNTEQTEGSIIIHYFHHDFPLHLVLNTN